MKKSTILYFATMMLMSGAHAAKMCKATDTCTNLVIQAIDFPTSGDRWEANTSFGGGNGHIGGGKTSPMTTDAWSIKNKKNGTTVTGMLFVSSSSSQMIQNTSTSTSHDCVPNCAHCWLRVTKINDTECFSNWMFTHNVYIDAGNACGYWAISYMNASAAQKILDLVKSVL
jgi:hypothetical protein